MNDASQELIAYCRERDRVCPLPPPWNQLWEMLPNRKRVGLGWEPPLPLILAGVVRYLRRPQDASIYRA